MTQAHIVYSGIVQGVGFRYTVQRLASSLRLAGWVRNLKDGRVEVLVEGEKATVERLMQNIETHFPGSIVGKELTYLPASGAARDFQITHDG